MSNFNLCHFSIVYPHVNFQSFYRGQCDKWLQGRWKILCAEQYWGECSYFTSFMVYQLSDFISFCYTDAVRNVIFTLSVDKICLYVYLVKEMGKVIIRFFLSKCKPSPTPTTGRETAYRYGRNASYWR